MNEEKTITIIKEIIEDLKDDISATKSDKFVIKEDSEKIEALQNILNLIDKQQTEIEALKSEYKDLFFENFELWEKNIFPTKAIEEKFISKEEIREKIKELENKIELAKGIDMLSSNIIEKAKNNILINMILRDILKELLEE